MEELNPRTGSLKGNIEKPEQKKYFSPPLHPEITATQKLFTAADPKWRPPHIVTGDIEELPSDELEFLKYILPTDPLDPKWLKYYPVRTASLSAVCYAVLDEIFDFTYTNNNSAPEGPKEFIHALSKSNHPKEKLMAFELACRMDRIRKYKLNL